MFIHSSHKLNLHFETNTYLPHPSHLPFPSNSLPDPFLAMLRQIRHLRRIPSSLRTSSSLGTRFLSTPPSEDPTTHFGFSNVPLSSKLPLVNAIFSSVASRYDVMNDLMSFRLHRIWKSLFVSDMSPTPQMKILDCAGGTGDITERIQQRVSDMGEWEQGGGVVVCDVNENMLEEGKKRFAGVPGLDFVLGDAEKLPFDDNSFDVYSISFGMRNVSQPDKALQEAFRVLKPGGRFMMLEFANISNVFLDQLYKAYSFNIIPRIGGLVAGDEASYRYLVESIDRFAGQEEFIAMVKATGFTSCRVVDYTGGVVAVYTGFKPVRSAKS